ncbi:hypothetical protein [Octadecabacter antarcticus]|nr:hypothetical protein [Octadecabacter antarcticus]
MSIFELLAVGSALMLIITGIIHSIAGEVYLLRPMFEQRGNRILEHKFGRSVLRAAWHLTSVMWVILAIILYAATFQPTNLAKVVFLSVGISFTAIGVFDLVASKGKHIGWPSLLLTGIFSLAALMWNT